MPKANSKMIDSHQHFWKFDQVGHAWITDEMQAIRRDFMPGDLQPLLKKHHIEGCVSVQVDQTEDETLSLLSLANQYPFIRGVVGWIDLMNPNLDSRLEYFSTLKKLKGFRHIVQGEKEGFLLNADFIRGVRKLAGYNFTYDLLIYHYQLDEAIAFLKEVPDIKIVVDHIAKPSIKTKQLAPWAAGIKTLSGFPNVYCKVSGMVTEADWTSWKYEDLIPYLDVVFGAFGTSRLLYGSDWPVCLLGASYDEQFSVLQQYLKEFSGEEKKAILGGNAETFYNL